MEPLTGGAPLWGMTDTVTVVGGGIAGLVAAITAAEEGATVSLLEARPSLGGRARTNEGRWAANWGPHALYADGPLWAWLAGRRLLPPCARPHPAGFRLRIDGRGRRRPPWSMVRSAGVLRRHEAPVDEPFRTWVTRRWGEEAAARWSAAAGVVTFSADPGALSAAFVHERLRRATTVPPAARFPVGGWTSLVARLEERARSLGVRVATGSRVDALPGGVVVVATRLPSAARLLGDGSVAWYGTRAALLDVGLRRRRGDAYVVSDLDECGWVERFSAQDPSLAPSGHSLVQAQLGLLDGESLESGVARLEALLDVGFPDWRSREVWRRRAVTDGHTGAVDPPGTTWRDRPAIDRGDGVFLCGDSVAAPGLLAEVSWASGVEAGRAAAQAIGCQGVSHSVAGQPSTAAISG